MVKNNNRNPNPYINYLITSRLACLSMADAGLIK